MVCKMGCYRCIPGFDHSKLLPHLVPLKYSIIHYTAFHDLHIHYDVYMQELTIWLECYFASLLFPFNSIFSMNCQWTEITILINFPLVQCCCRTVEASHHILLCLKARPTWHPSALCNNTRFMNLVFWPVPTGSCHKRTFILSLSRNTTPNTKSLNHPMSHC